jgi:catalase
MPAQEIFDKKDGATYTTSNGAPHAVPYEAQRIGSNGPLLLQGTWASEPAVRSVLIDDVQIST